MEAKQGADPEVSELAADTEDPEVLELGAGPEDPELQLEPEPEPEPERRIVLVSKEGDEFEVEERLALLSPTITRMIEDGSRISLPSIRSKILTKLIEFARKYVDSQAAATHDLSWGEDFVCTIDPPCLTQLILVSLGSPLLLGFACRTVGIHGFVDSTSHHSLLWSSGH